MGIVGIPPTMIGNKYPYLTIATPPPTVERNLSRVTKYSYRHSRIYSIVYTPTLATFATVSHIDGYRCINMQAFRMIMHLSFIDMQGIASVCKDMQVKTGVKQFYFTVTHCVNYVKNVLVMCLM